MANQETKKRVRPYRVRIPGFISETEIGLGEVVRRATYRMGLKPCDGCSRRAAALDRWLVFTSKHSR